MEHTLDRLADILRRPARHGVPMLYFVAGLAIGIAIYSDARGIMGDGLGDIAAPNYAERLARPASEQNPHAWLNQQNPPKNHLLTQRDAK